MRGGGFEPPKALSHKISYKILLATLPHGRGDVLSLAHLTALLPSRTSETRKGIIKVIVLFSKYLLVRINSAYHCC